jgi:hypothetical protein
MKAYYNKATGEVVFGIRAVIKEIHTELCKVIKHYKQAEKACYEMLGQALKHKVRRFIALHLKQSSIFDWKVLPNK